MTSTPIEGFPLSPQQKYLWRLMIDNPSFRAVAAFRMEGPLDLTVLERALSGLLHHHSILRTRFALPPGLKYPLQDFSEDDDFSTTTRTTLNDANQDIAALVMREANRPLDEADRFRTHIVTIPLEREKHLVLFNIPAICCDGWSLRQLAYDLGEHYEAARSDHDVEEESVNYVAYAEWLTELEDESESANAFWDAQQANAVDQNPLTALMLPIESGKPVHPDRIAPGDWRLETGDRPESFWLACWALFLARYAGTTSITLATAFHGRTFEDLETGCGPYTRYPPMTLELDFASSISQIIEKVDQQKERFSQRQSFFRPEKNEVPPDLGFEWEDGDGSFEEDGLPVSVRLVEEWHWDAPFGLKLHIADLGDCFRPTFYFDRRRFQPTVVEGLIAHFRTLVHAAAASPDQTAGMAPILSRTESQRLLARLNGSTRAHEPNPPVHRQFEAMVARMPLKTALVFQPAEEELRETRLSFAGLNQEANRLAHFLIARGAGPERPVAICFDRSANLIIAMLAALKTGGGYIPIEPHLPDARIKEMVLGSGATLLLAQEQRPLEKTDFAVYYLERERSLIEAQPVHNPDVHIEPHHLVYGIFTSGSTGRPKAVGVTHANLGHYLDAVRVALDLTDGDHYAVVSTLAADLGNTSIFPALCGGGALHLLSERHISDADAFADYIAKHDVDCLKITPSHLATLMTGSTQILPRKKLILGGEATPDALLRQIQTVRPDLEIFNHYGPSETTVGTLTHRAHPDQPDFPLGLPIPNSRVYPLDPYLEPVPPGVAGELYIAGPGVTRGYLYRPDLTAARYLPDPFSGRAGERMYKTGDRVRLQTGKATPLIEFLGRVDYQIKLRGFRIELGEIEARLMSHPSISKAVVVHNRESERLVAYLEPVAGANPDEIEPHQLRLFLLESLPDYMTPAAFMVLDRLPLNANGKIDRKALPEPTGAAADQAEYVAPGSESERALAAIWENLLKIDRIGANDHFFELGGHSFLAIRTIAAIKEQLEINLPVRVLLENPRLSDFARLIDQARQETSQTKRVRNAPETDPTRWRENHADHIEIRSLAVNEQTLCIWFTNLDSAEVMNLIQECPEEYLPHYIRQKNLAIRFDAAPSERDARFEVLGLRNQFHTPKAASAYFMERVAASRARIQEAFQAGPALPPYPGGHHPAWFIRREVRAINLADFSGEKGFDEQRVRRHINRFIAKQGLLRSILTEQNEDYGFSEVETLELKDLTVFDLSGSTPASREIGLTGIQYAMWEELYRLKPPLDAILYNVTAVRLDDRRYQILFAFDHIIADYEIKRVVGRHFECLNRSAAGDAAHMESLAATPFRDFGRIMVAPPLGDPSYEDLKKDPVFNAFREPVIRIQEQYEVGEPIVYTKSYLLEGWLNQSGEDHTETNYLGHGLATAVRVLALAFELEDVPLRVLVSRRYFHGKNFYNTIGDFHDSVPVLFPGSLKEPVHFFETLQKTDRYYGDANLNISAAGGDPEIYRHCYKSPFSFNFVGEIPEREEPRILLSAGMIRFLVFPFYAYHVGNRLGLIINHGLRPDMEQRLRTFLGEHFDRWRLRLLDEHFKAELSLDIETKKDQDRT